MTNRTKRAPHPALDSPPAPEATEGLASVKPFPAADSPHVAPESQGDALAAGVAQEQAQPAGESEQAGKPVREPMTVEELTDLEEQADRLKELIRGVKHDRDRKRRRETPRSYTLKPVARAMDDILDDMEGLVAALDWICEGARDETPAYDRGPIRAVAGIAKTMRAKLEPMSGLLHQVDHFDSIRLDVFTTDPHVELEAEAESIRTAWLADQTDEDAADEDPCVQAIDNIERKTAGTTALTLPGIAAQVRLALRLATKEGDDHASLGSIEVQGLRSALASLEALSKPEAPTLA